MPRGCNFTNNFQNAACYRGEHPEVAMQLLKRFDVPCVLGFFGRLGILPKQRDGYWYPNRSRENSSSCVLMRIPSSSASLSSSDNKSAEIPVNS